MRRTLLLAVVLGASFPTTASAYEECGNPRGAAKNVTAVAVACGDARAFARKVARQRVTRSGWIALPGWHEYYARVRRVHGEYDVRATRGRRVIRFQYASRGSSRSCDPNYSGACLDPSSTDYDCEGGSGDGPDYTGLVYVVGDDHYGLDRDGDGTGCD